ncbi:MULTISPECIES: acyl-CoA dehydrogenase family protein [unclassified Delftia]|uniref:acyl-CoA dehydrogenase family protein n=1 Tax=unclassified Delftia TaxID=2613839 RepID=UPI001901BED2|nr:MULTISPECIES: acyl-CoA dehydrogenase family protein [unclassified Delftia]MBK0114059.1 acyl-CoA dehydrogenase family protein [Delftia sp. S65]MBK0117867.1 acyl-CoA dehydrogenase family protein [Delftia sp. S67]MBK0129134.1 acyl-CoA dehydrogenase family protein [Delftia sp. S66]
MPISFERSWSDADIEQYRSTVVRFIEEHVIPGDELARQKGHVERALWSQAGALGLLCSDIPEKWGGAGGDFRHEAVFYEEMARRSLSGMNHSVHNIVAHYILNHGTEAQKRRYLPRLVSGECIGAIAMTEPGAGSDLKAVRTRAEHVGSQWVINGAKTFISNGLLAGLVLVVAKTSPTEGARGMSIFLVETANCTGFRVGRLLDKIGLKAQDTAELFFDDVRVEDEHLLGGTPDQAFAQLMSDLPYERLVIAVMAVAAMEGAYAATLAHVRDRQVFGQALAQLQHTRFTLAEIATEIQVGRVFVDRCVEDLLAARLDTATASMAKLWTSEAQGRVVDVCVQLFGGYGYMTEYLVARMYTDARIQRIYGGTSEIMKEVIARAL